MSPMNDDEILQPIIIYNNSYRKLALDMCGWDFATVEGEEKETLEAAINR